MLPAIYWVRLTCLTFPLTLATAATFAAPSKGYVLAVGLMTITVASVTLTGAMAAAARCALPRRHKACLTAARASLIGVFVMVLLAAFSLT